MNYVTGQQFVLEGGQIILAGPPHRDRIGPSGVWPGAGLDEKGSSAWRSSPFPPGSLPDTRNRCWQRLRRGAEADVGEPGCRPGNNRRGSGRKGANGRGGEGGRMPKCAVNRGPAASAVRYCRSISTRRCRLKLTQVEVGTGYDHVTVEPMRREGGKVAWISCASV